MHEKTFHFIMTFHKLIDNTPLHNIHWQRVLNTKPKIKRIQALLNSYFEKLWANKSCFVILIFYRLKSRPTFHYVWVLSDCVFFAKIRHSFSYLDYYFEIQSCLTHRSQINHIIIFVDDEKDQFYKDIDISNLIHIHVCKDDEYINFKDIVNFRIHFQIAKIYSNNSEANNL